MTPEMMNVFDPHCIFNSSSASGTAPGAGNHLSTTRATGSPAPKAFVGQTLGGSCSKRTPQPSTRNADPGAGLEAWASAMPTSTGVCPLRPMSHGIVCPSLTEHLLDATPQGGGMLGGGVGQRLGPCNKSLVALGRVGRHHRNGSHHLRCHHL